MLHVNSTTKLAGERLARRMKAWSVVTLIKTSNAAVSLEVA